MALLSDTFPVVLEGQGIVLTVGSIVKNSAALAHVLRQNAIPFNRQTIHVRGRNPVATATPLSGAPMPVVPCTCAAYSPRGLSTAPMIA